MATLTESKKQLIDKWRSLNVPEEILKAFEAVPREEFLPEEKKSKAYLDQPLHIGHDQTISQPSTVINMLTLLEPAATHKVLEIGVGSGYVCALLARIGCEVIGLEIIPELSIRAGKALRKLKLDSAVTLHAADGGAGWEEAAPFDRILVSAAMPTVPRHILWQLKNNGILVAPVGTVEQRMLVCRKKNEGEIIEEDHGAYVFVPMTGKHIEEQDGDVPGMPFA